MACLEYESIREQVCLMLSLAAGLKQPYTGSLPLVDGLSPPRQPQRNIQYRNPGLSSCLLVVQGSGSPPVRHLVVSTGCRLAPS